MTRNTINRPENLTPMFRQYYDLKERYPDSLLLFRCGDFYELYGDDAVRGSRLMEISLTSRDMSRGKRIEMAGVPHHALDNYLRTLIAKGVKVAVCEQMEDPKKSKGLVKRDVTRVITSGTVTDPGMLNADENNYLMAVATDGETTGIAVADVSTGHLRITSLPSDKVSRLQDEIFRIRPSEVVIDQHSAGLAVIREYLLEMDIPWSINTEPIHGELCREILKSAFVDLDKISGWDENPAGSLAAAALVEYLNQTQKTSRHSLSDAEFYRLADFMILDAITWRNLELSHTMMERQKKGSLLWVLDETKTGMGARLLRSWLERPLIDVKRIEARQNAVGEMVENFSLLEGTVGKLKDIYDLERITTRVIYGSANARDVLALGNSLAPLPGLKALVSECKSSLLQVLYESLDPLEDVARLIHDAIAPDPALTLREGNVIADGYNLELDELRSIRRDARQWIAGLETRERESTGIKSLKIKFNNVFGYYIEVTRPNLHLVPEGYVRKQTIANGERFISPQLKEYESKILGAEEKINELEYRLFMEVREQVGAQSARIQQTSRVIAALDVLSSLGTVASRYNYCRPVVVKDDTLEICGGRHPVVERSLKDGFVANDTTMEGEHARFHIITGPNMSGKSTYLRQVGLISIMAQMGSYVPADSAVVGLVDRVFTRVGASDDLHLGKSTFLVEMNETANIINNASRGSLVLLDEIGRGTSTYDGLSIAWAVCEYIHDRISARTLFATHFHQLNQLEERLPGVKNFRVDVKETSREIIFLHRIVPGGTDKSYGIYVARLAGLPNRILSRAGEVLEQLEAGHQKARPEAADGGSYQLTFYDLFSSPLVDEIRRANPDEMSPRDALDKIYQWKRTLE